MIELVKVALKKGMVDITEEQRVALKEEIADILKEFGTAKWLVSSRPGPLSPGTGLGRGMKGLAGDLLSSQPASPGIRRRHGC